MYHHSRSIKSSRSSPSTSSSSPLSSTSSSTITISRIFAILMTSFGILQLFLLKELRNDMTKNFMSSSISSSSSVSSLEQLVHHRLQLRRNQQQQSTSSMSSSSLSPPLPKCIDVGLEFEQAVEKEQDDAAAEADKTTIRASKVMEEEEEIIKRDVVEDNNSNNDDGFAACLIIMDDNHYLIEWLAYHYTVLPLRRLIVAIDPRSKTSPKLIFDRYRSKGFMDITEWYNETYYFPLQEETSRLSSKYLPNEPMEYEKEIHYSRQRYFYSKCMETLINEYNKHNNEEHHNKQAMPNNENNQQSYTEQGERKQQQKQLHDTSMTTKNKKKSTKQRTKKPLWTMFIDTDEYILYNQNVPLSRKQLLPYRANHTIYSTLETAKNVYWKTVLSTTSSKGQGISEEGIRSDDESSSSKRKRRRSLGNNTKNGLSSFAVDRWTTGFSSASLGENSQNWNNCDNLYHLGQTIVENPCMLIPRLTMGTKQLEDDDIDQNYILDHLLPSNNKDQFNKNNNDLFNNITNFITLSYRYHDGLTNFNTNRHNKGIIDLSVIANNQEGGETLPLIPELIVEVHSPIRQYCDKQGNNRIKRSSFVINHYIGTWEQWSYRNDIRRTKEKYINKGYDKGYDDSMIQIRQQQGLPSSSAAAPAPAAPALQAESSTFRNSHIWVQQLFDKVGNDHSIMEELLQDIGQV